ncbi:hypothetical protein FRC12_013420 [Ceratobasidium sp. 428]|nr:hypothetical protein FRC12_013420 [Ceratobasidium sp. 428]
MGRIFSRSSEERDNMHTIILFTKRSDEVDQMLSEVRGERTQISSLRYIDYVVRLGPSKARSSVTILKLASFENTQLSDFTVYCEVGFDIQDYVKKHINKQPQHSFSAIYLHLDSDLMPTLVTQRNFRAARQLCQTLGLLDFSLFVMSPTSQKSSFRRNTLQSSPFKEMEDSVLWNQHLAFSDSRPIGEFIDLALKHRQGSIYAGPTQALTGRTLVKSFCQVEVEHLSGLQEERVSLIQRVERAEAKCRKAEEAAQVAETALQTISAQHNSLLQHLNLRDNTELSDVVHQFRGLNEDIDGFSLELAGTMPDSHFEHYPDCARCHDPEALRKWFAVAHAPPLLFESSSSVPMPTRQFLELFIASFICEILCNWVFRPFCPIIPGNQRASVQIETFALVYERLRLCNQQITAAKWRIETYSSLIKLDSTRGGHVTETSLYIARVIETAVHHLLGVKVQDLADHTRLTQLVKRAYELNHRIKAEVAYAGDIHADYFQYDHEYDDARMKVLDSKKGDPLPVRIVSTCGLGVYLTKAIGGGKAPELAVLLKAIVASEQVYD